MTRTGNTRPRAIPAGGADRVRRLRSSAQWLHRPESGTPPAVLAGRLGGIQAQVLSAAALAFRARTAGLTAAGVQSARVEERSLLWTWAMRGTLHLVAMEDAGWLLPLLSPRWIPAAYRRLAQLGVDRAAAEKGVRAIRRMVASGPRSRDAMAVRLARLGIPTEQRQAVHLARLATLEGAAVPGPDRDGDMAFVAPADWIGRVPRALDRPAALVELARRHVASHGPVTPADLAAWSGLSVKDARAGFAAIADELEESSVGRERAWIVRGAAREEPPAGIVRLVPSFDPYLLGYRSRALALPARHAPKVFPGGGWLHPAVIADGRAVGTWRSERRRDTVDVTVEPFGTLDARVRRALEDEANDVAAFLGAKAGRLTSPRARS